ncbi:APC family permease [Virgisporangium aurantiacum]|uniref:APC family permease n=1 Tax=Virgisporangium aurantiacum TaxID=175570 RepID=UPI0019518FBE|nr:APC family permease [Virgisporangium aurantiacum]
MSGAQTVLPVNTQLTADGEPRLQRSVSWRSLILLAIGAALQITVVMGAMAGELGNLHLLVWAGAAFVGLVQCFLIAEMAKHAPHRAGGAATYAQEAFGGRTSWVAALSGWGYWFAWTPGIAVNLILAAEYLESTVWPDVNTVALSAGIGVALYAVNTLGLRHLVRISAVLMVLAGLTLLALLVTPLFQPSLFDAGELSPLAAPADTEGSTWELLVKWFFVATWSAYGAEIAASIVAELREPAAKVMRAMVTAGVVCLAAFAIVPIVMTGIVGADGLSESPSTVFLAPAEVVFGDAGRLIVGVMLACALILGAQAYIIASSRTVYQLSKDAHLPRLFTRVNRFGVPVMSVICDAAVIAVLLLIFGSDVVDVVAAANIGYLVVFVLMPLGFVIVRVRRRRAGQPLVLHPVWTGIGVAVVALNAVLLVVGAALWGVEIWLTGLIVMTLIFPLIAWRRWRDRVDARRHEATADPAESVPAQPVGATSESER